MTAPKGSVRLKCEAPGCGKSFHSQRSTRKYCSDSCRSRARRRGPAAGDSDLVKAVRSELRAAGKLATVHGQSALLAATQLAGAGPAQVATLLRELDRVMDRALGRTPGRVEPEADRPAEPEDDEISQARARKLAKERALAEAQ